MTADDLDLPGSVDALAPYLIHLPDCRLKPCTCGLVKAVAQVRDNINDQLAEAVAGEDW
jgi:hypothetical protein